MQKIVPYLRLMRPPNLITAVADILLGFAAAGCVLMLGDTYGAWFSISNLAALGWLVLATIGLYGGGVVFNDVFDAELDKVERPERPIPSGQASLLGASLLGLGLLGLGVLAAAQVSLLSAAIAVVVALLAVTYDAAGKHHPVLGPLNMGACRGGNLLLGISAFPLAVEAFWYLAFIPIVYISAITLIAQGEVHGGNRKAIFAGGVLYAMVIGGICCIVLLREFELLFALPFLLLFAWLIYTPLVRAWHDPKGRNVMLAVKAGVLSLIVMDAAIAAGFAGWGYGLLVLLLLPLSRFIAKQFAVT